MSLLLSVVFSMPLAVAPATQFGPPYQSPCHGNYLDVTNFGANPAVNSGTTPDGDAVRDAIDCAMNTLTGPITIHFPAGIYEIDADPNSLAINYDQCGIYMNGAQDITFEGAPGAEIRFRDRNRHGFVMKYCSNITLRDLTLRYEGLAHFEGEIVSYASEEEHSSGLEAPRYEIELLESDFINAINDPFLFATSEMEWQFHAYDSVTRRHKPFSLQQDVVAIDVVPPSTVYLFMKGDDPNVDPMALNIATGSDRAVVAAKRITDENASFFLRGYVIRSRFSNDTHVEDVIFESSPLFASQHSYESGVEYRRCKIIPDPDIGQMCGSEPCGSLISTNRDGFRFIGNRTGPKIIDCTFERLGDDSINILSDWHEVTAVLPASNGILVQVKNRSNPNQHVEVKDGDTLQFLDANYANTVTATASSDAVLVSVGPDKEAQFSVVLGPVPSVGDFMVVRDAMADGFEVTGNTVREIRARGLYARGLNGTIDDNLIAGTTLQGIVTSPEFSFFTEAGFVEGLTISNNTIHAGGYKLTTEHSSAANLGQISVGFHHNQPSWPTGTSNKDVTISNNWISTARMVGLFLGNVDDVDVTDNHILSSQLSPAPGAGSGIGIPVGSTNGVIHVQNGINICRTGNILDTHEHSGAVIPEVSDNGILEDCPSGDTGQTYSTSFEDEEDWVPSLPKFAGWFSPTQFPGTYTLNGLTFAFIDWDLYGNHHKWHHYRGFVSSRCQTAGGALGFAIPAPGLVGEHTLKFWAAANTPGGGASYVDWTLKVEVKQPGVAWALVELDNVPGNVISSADLQYPPDFTMFTGTLPPGTRIVRFTRDGGDTAPPYLYLDDVVVHPSN